MKRLIKPFRKSTREVVAYDAEKNFLDKMSELGENLSGGKTVATDTVSFGGLKIHWALKSPVKYESNGQSTTMSLSGGTAIEVGVTIDHGSSGGGGYSGTISKEANPFYDPSGGGSGEGNGHDKGPQK